jgi:hypothetical protein
LVEVTRATFGPSHTLIQVGKLKDNFPFPRRAAGTEMDREKKIFGSFEKAALVRGWFSQ